MHHAHGSPGNNYPLSLSLVVPFVVFSSGLSCTVYVIASFKRGRERGRGEMYFLHLQGFCVPVSVYRTRKVTSDEASVLEEQLHLPLSLSLCSLLFFVPVHVSSLQNEMKSNAQCKSRLSRLQLK